MGRYVIDKNSATQLNGCTDSERVGAWIGWLSCLRHERSAFREMNKGTAVRRKWWGRWLGSLCACLQACRCRRRMLPTNYDRELVERFSLGAKPPPAPLNMVGSVVCIYMHGNTATICPNPAPRAPPYHRSPSPKFPPINRSRSHLFSRGFVALDRVASARSAPLTSSCRSSAATW